MLLFLASHGYVPAFFWFPSFVTRSNLSSFATGSSLQAESPLSVVRAFFLIGSLLVCFSWCPFLYVPISLLPSSRCVGSPLLRQVFLDVSLPPFFAGWHSRLRLWCLYFLVSAALSPSGFSLLLSSPVGGFSLVLFPYSSCSPINFLLFTVLSFLLLGRETGKFSRLLPQVSSFGSSASLRPLRLASSSIPYGPPCPGDTFACLLPYRLLCIDPVVMVLVRSLPYRTLFVW